MAQKQNHNEQTQSSKETCCRSSTTRPTNYTLHSPHHVDYSKHNPDTESSEEEEEEEQHR
jgi:hypothetical protein